MTLSLEQRQERLNRPCKRCGKPLNSLTKSQVACTGGCLGWNKAVDVECKVCGIVFEATEGRLKKFGDLCCSKTCQSQLALVDNRCRIKVDWDKRSRKAKEKWKRVSSKMRRSLWFNAVKARLSKIGYRPSDSWHAAVSSRLSTSLGRERVRSQKARHSQSVREALSRVDRKREWHESSALYKKVVNKLSNNRKRRARKNVRKREKSSENRCEDKGVWVQMCLDWMDD